MMSENSLRSEPCQILPDEREVFNLEDTLQFGRGDISFPRVASIARRDTIVSHGASSIVFERNKVLQHLVLSFSAVGTCPVEVVKSCDPFMEGEGCRTAVCCRSFQIGFYDLAFFSTARAKRCLAARRLHRHVRKPANRAGIRMLSFNLFLASGAIVEVRVPSLDLRHLTAREVLMASATVAVIEIVVVGFLIEVKVMSKHGIPVSVMEIAEDLLYILFGLRQPGDEFHNGPKGLFLRFRRE